MLHQKKVSNCELNATQAQILLRLTPGGRHHYGLVGEKSSENYSSNLLTLSGPRGTKLASPLVLITCCSLKNADMNSKLLDNFSFDLI